jgi:DNA repair protein RadC
MAISDWPLMERPREKLLAKGPAALSDAELLAIFIHSHRRGSSAVDSARRLLTEFGSLRRLLDADRDSFYVDAGGGVVAFAQLQAALEISCRYLESPLIHNSVIAKPEDTRRYLLAKLGRYQREVFACLFLDNRHRVIGFDELFFGTIDAATVHPREIVKRALHHNAAAVTRP